MDAVLRKVDAHLRRGITLADRRAFYSARTEFIAALRLLAQGLDAQESSTKRGEALARGIWALEEADDFLPRGTALNADIQVQRLAATHRTSVLKEVAKTAVSKESSAAAPADITPLAALQKYYTYAQEQLAAAVRPSREGSQVLTALGKLYVEMDQEPARLAADARTKGLVCQQAALLVDSGNARAANELGVLLAREGRFEEAREWLRHSVRLAPRTETWHNLAAVHTSLGEVQLAEAARQQSELARRQNPAAASTVQVKQVTPAEFAGGTKTDARTATAPSSAPATQAAGAAKTSSVWDWLPWR